MANVEDTPWWLQVIGGLFGSALTALMAGVGWLAKDRAEMRRLVESHARHLKELQETHDLWEDGHVLDKKIERLRSDVDNMKERLDRWSRRAQK